MQGSGFEFDQGRRLYSHSRTCFFLGGGEVFPLASRVLLPFYFLADTKTLNRTCRQEEILLDNEMYIYMYCRYMYVQNETEVQRTAKKKIFE